MEGLTVALKPSVRLLDGTRLEEPGYKRLRFPEARRAFLLALAQGAGTEEELCGTSRELRYLLALLEREGWLRYCLAWDGEALAALEPLARSCRFTPAAGDGTWRLSRFTWIRRLDSAVVLENPLGFGRVLLHAPRLLEPVARLCRPRAGADLGLPPPLARALLAMLASAGAAVPCGAGGESREDLDPALRPWEFHDLLFHSRSREGRHAEPTGATCRFLGDLAPLPALKPPGPGGIPLPGPGTDPGPAFFQVLEARRSIRGPGREPITLGQLGAFLHHVARVRAVAPPDPGAGRMCETVSGPCPGGGGLHELELYLTVSRCAGLEPGFYHYGAGAHALEPWPDPGASAELVRHARKAMGAACAPDLLITLTARFQRVAWKYQSLAYALILKNVGVVYQQMYLVATALGLAPCALGTGDTQVFARASGLAYAKESSVGEFALSG